MSGTVEVRGRRVAVAACGSEGEPIVYLHGWADVHSLTAELMPFHRALGARHRLIAPALPGVNGSDEMEDEGYRIADVTFHLMETMDALGLERFHLVGHCAGGWLAAELAVRHPERVASLALIGASGLFVPGEPTADVFMHAQPERGIDYTSLRAVLFARPDSAPALRYFPDGRGDLDEETRRYQMLRLGSFMGFKPPYFYNRPLRDRLGRATMPSIVLWGERDGFVPRAHGEAYAQGLGNCRGLVIVRGAGHSVVLEQGEAAAALIARFLDGVD